MPGSKCSKCGLVNPFGLSQCKRCGFTLILTNVMRVANSEPGDGFAVKSTLYEPREQWADRLTQGVCSICGTCDDCAMVNFKKSYTPPWAYAFALLGFLVVRIVQGIFEVTYHFSLPLCRKCSQRHKWARLVSRLAVAGCGGLFIVAIIVGIANESWLSFLVISSGVIAVAVFAGRFDRQANPRYARLNRKQVEIEVPGRGRVIVVDRASG